MLSPFFVLGGGDSQLDGDVVEDYLGAPTRVGQHKHWHPFRRVHRYWLDEKNKSGKVSQLKCVPHMGAKMTCSGPALLNKLMAPVTLISTNNKSLHIMGAMMVEIRVEKEVTGLYLSLSACEDLEGVLLWNKEDSSTAVNGIKHVDEDREKEKKSKLSLHQ